MFKNFKPAEFGERMKQARIEKALTQKELAEFLNVSIAQISDIERGKSSPSLKRAVLIASCLDVSLDYLTGIETEKSIPCDPLFHTIGSLTYDERLLVIGYIDCIKAHR